MKRTRTQCAGSTVPTDVDAHRASRTLGHGRGALGKRRGAAIKMVSRTCVVVVFSALRSTAFSTEIAYVTDTTAQPPCPACTVELYSTTAHYSSTALQRLHSTALCTTPQLGVAIPGGISLLSPSKKPVTQKTVTARLTPHARAGGACGGAGERTSGERRPERGGALSSHCVPRRALGSARKQASQAQAEERGLT